MALTESEYQVAWLILQRRLNRNRNDHTDPRTGVLVETPAFARDEAAIIYEHNVETYRKMGLIMDDPPMIDDDDEEEERDQHGDVIGEPSEELVNALNQRPPDAPITESA